MYISLSNFILPGTPHGGGRGTRKAPSLKGGQPSGMTRYRGALYRSLARPHTLREVIIGR